MKNTRLLFATACILFSLFRINAETTDTQLSTDSMPEAWTYQRQFSQTLPSDDQWWKSFDDPILTNLISRAEQGSYDLQATLRRIEAARITWQSAKAAYFPTLGVAAGWSKNRSSGKTSPGGVSATSDYFSLGLNLNWEIDVFGRVKKNSDAGKAAWQASKSDYTAAVISLCANVAKAYFNLRAVQAEIEVAIEQVRTQEKVAAIARARFETGLVSKLDVAQANSVLFSTQATLPSLEAQEQSAINSIALLCGCFPGEISEMLSQPGELPNPYTMVNVGVPADLLRRRPDIVAAEYDLARYAALVGVAKKDFLPTLSISGSIGTAAHDFDKLFSDGSFTYSVAPQLSWTIFDGLARNYRVAEAKQQMLAAIDTYNSTVMQAYSEATDAMSAYSFALSRIGFEQKVKEQSDETLTLSLDRYKQGLSDFTNVMSALTSCLNSQDSLIEARLSALLSLVQIYSSLGGNPQQQ